MHDIIREQLEKLQEELYKKDFDEKLKRLKENVELEEKAQTQLFKKVFKDDEEMSQHDILFSITEDGRDVINFQVHGSEIPNILNQKQEVLEIMERLKKAKRQ